MKTFNNLKQSSLLISLNTVRQQESSNKNWLQRVYGDLVICVQMLEIFDQLLVKLASILISDRVKLSLRASGHAIFVGTLYRGYLPLASRQGTEH